MVLDGVINPPSYTSAGHGDGDVAGPDTTSFLRILSPQGSAAALDQFLTRCADVGADYCLFAAESAAATRAKFAALMDRLRGAGHRPGPGRHPDGHVLAGRRHRAWRSLCGSPLVGPPGTGPTTSRRG